MKRGTNRWLTRGLGTVLALVVSSTIVQGGYTPPPKSNSPLGDVSEFVGDYGQWNASLNNLPMEFLEMTPTAGQGNTVVLEFLFWLLDSGAGSAGKALPSSQSGRSGFDDLFPPPSSGGSAHAPIGSIVMGQSESDPPSLRSNGGNDPLGIGGKGEKDPPLLLPDGGNGLASLHSGDGGDPPGIRVNNENSSFLSNPGSLSGRGSSGHQFGSIPPSGWAGGDSGLMPLSPDTATPAPASIMLLAVGGGGLLVGLWMGRRRLARHPEDLFSRIRLARFGEYR